MNFKLICPIMLVILMGCGKADPAPVVQETVSIPVPPMIDDAAPTQCDLDYIGCLQDALRKDCLKKTQPHVDKCVRDLKRCQDDA